MKVGSAVLGLHVAAVCLFAMTQGCVTSESQGSGRGAGARHKGPWKHEYKGPSTEGTAVAQDYGYKPVSDSVFDSPVITSSDSRSSVEPYAPPKTKSTAGTEVYIVQKGDILSRLASDFNTTTKTLISMNNLSNPDVLYVGQELRVPAGGGKSSHSSSSSKSSSSSVKKGGDYVIQKGDTLSGIAVAAGVSIDSLRSLNNIKDDKIFAGEKLSIPSGGKIPSTSHKSTPAKAKTEPTPPVEPAPSAVAEPAPAPVAAPAAEPVESTSSMSVDAVMDHVVYPGETL
ncbi:MAG: LysM peptidoglycan-binding domain-containing protein, partial [Kiritimatiellales bacterium]|nr:LysM peptidoglycan-binding domain-containing protein [Kiritimatiellales bacterium]